MLSYQTTCLVIYCCILFVQESIKRYLTEYNHTEAQVQMIEWVEQQFGKWPHEWQLDVAEVIYLGLDTILISPTGSGKSLPFVIPLAKHNPTKKIIMISPLIALQLDMVTFSLCFVVSC